MLGRPLDDELHLAAGLGRAQMGFVWPAFCVAAERSAPATRHSKVG
jgi:hypothetical protein